jgi:hypothetical protein
MWQEAHFPSPMKNRFPAPESPSATLSAAGAFSERKGLQAHRADRPANRPQACPTPSSFANEIAQLLDGGTAYTAAGGKARAAISAMRVGSVAAGALAREYFLAVGILAGE